MLRALLRVQRAWPAQEARAVRAAVYVRERIRAASGAHETPTIVDVRLRAAEEARARAAAKAAVKRGAADAAAAEEQTTPAVAPPTPAPAMPTAYSAEEAQRELLSLQRILGNAVRIGGWLLLSGHSESPGSHFPVRCCLHAVHSEASHTHSLTHGTHRARPGA